MKPMLVIFCVVVGSIAALLIPASGKLARRFWPGPTVKGPGDVYVQAFQGLLCMGLLCGVALIASVAALILSASTQWPAGLWMSGVPIIGMATTFFVLWMQSRR